MKIRKIFAGMSALAIMATMAVSVSAADDEAFKVPRTWKGNGGEESWFDNGFANSFIDTTSLGEERGKIDKIVFEYETDAELAIGKVAANIKANNKKGFKWLGPTSAAFAKASTSEDTSNPTSGEITDSKVDGATKFESTFDEKTGKGSYTWSGLAGKLFFDATDEEFDFTDGGDSTGLTFQFGGMNNLGTDTEKVYSPATFTVTGVHFYDASGNELGIKGVTDTNTPSDKTDTNTPSDKTDTNTPSDKTDTNTPSDKTDTNTPGDKTDTNTPSDKTDTNTPSDQTDTNNPSDQTDTNTPSDSSNPSTGAAAGIALAGIAVAGAAIAMSKKRK